MPLRAKTTKGKIKEEAEHLKAKSSKYSNREAFGIATRIVTGRGPKKHKRKKGRKKMARKRKRYGDSHMDRGTSFADTHQGYYSPGGKPKPKYTEPPNGYIDQGGMPNASSRKKALQHMSAYYGGAMKGSSSTNAGTSPKVGDMDSTMRRRGRRKR